MESAIAVFKEPQQAQGALQALQERGFARENLGFALRDPVAENDLAQATGVSPEEGAPGGSGEVIKGMLIGVVASLVLTVPIWLLLVAFPVTRVYAHGGVLGIWFGVIGGAGMGGLVGALTGSDLGDYVKLMRTMGVPAAQAERFTSSLNDGNVLVFARDNDGSVIDDALSLMRRHGAVRLDDAVGGGRLRAERSGQDGH